MAKRRILTTMYYYEVWVTSIRYKGIHGLTYASTTELAAGSIVRVELQRELTSGVVVRQTTRPKLKTIKPITDVIDLPPLAQTSIELAIWLQAYYPAPISAVAQLFIPAVIPKHLKPIAPLPQSTTPVSLPPLTDEQAAAVKAMKANDSYLLVGRTGSGKTRVYQELASHQLTAGRSVLVLSPEIGLTSQLAANFEAIAPRRVLVLHSKLTAAQRLLLWRTISSAKEPLIVIGPRSALFSPIHQLGLVVVDESHEPTYKQEQAPRYHANRVAAVTARLHTAQLVLGSATPLITDYHLAEQKRKPIITMHTLAKAGKYTANVEVVDLKDRTYFTRSPYLSDILLTHIKTSLSRGEQSLLYLNRRGTAKVSLCQHCGWQALCPNCDLPLTYHGDSYQFRCHLCNYTEPVPTVCPSCGHVELTFRSIGTKAVVEEVRRLFPEARVARFDSDTAKAERFEAHYQDILAGNVDILVGTQTLAKGIDLPLLSTLGILIADTSLYLPDYTAHERTYQLITQVLGRVQRGHRASAAIIQTYNTQSPALRDALQGNWGDFYSKELEERHQYLYPPFVFLLKLTCRRASAKSAERAATDLKKKLLAQHDTIHIDGPAPSMHEKFRNTYEWQLTVKSTNRTTLLEIMRTLPANWTADIDPINLL